MTSSGDSVLPAGITRRMFQPGDEDQILDVLNAAFERWPKAEIDVPQIEHLRWKLSGHRNALARTGVGEVDERIVVVTIPIRHEAKVGGRLVVAFQGTDAAIVPEFQNMGFSKSNQANPMKERDEALVGIDLAFGVGRAHPALERIRASDPNPMPRVERNLEALLRPRAAFPTKVAAAPWDIRRIEAFDGRIDAFWEEASLPFAFMLVRKRDYLNWRYCDRRAGPFIVKIAEQDGRTLGYAVYRVSYGRGYIADLIALPDRPDVVESLLADAVRDLESKGVESIECWSYERHPHWPLLQRSGFINRRRTMKVAISLPPKSSLTAADLQLVSAHDAIIHVMSGDTDLV